MDIPFTLVTAVYVSSELKFDFGIIARSYARTWLLPDVLIVLSQWVFLALPADMGRLGWFRILKGFRALRLLRAVKMQNMVVEQLKRVNSKTCLQLAYLVELVFCFLILNHFVACGWYAVGNAESDGWFAQKAVHASDAPVATGYTLALHWSITQFHGSVGVQSGNRNERLFAVAILILGMLTFSMFVSLITDMMFTVRRSRQRYIEVLERIHNFFQRHGISPDLLVGTKKFLDEKGKWQEDWIEDRTLLGPIPIQLQKILLAAARFASVGQYLCFVWLNSLHTAALRDLCHSVLNSFRCLVDEFVFETCGACHRRCFVERGVLAYTVSTNGQRQDLFESKDALPEGLGLTPSAKRRMTKGNGFRFSKSTLPAASRPSGSGSNVEKLTKRCWVSEPALWIQGWQTRGNLWAVADSTLIAVESDHFAQVVRVYPMTHFEVCLYARWFLDELLAAPPPEGGCRHLEGVADIRRPARIRNAECQGIGAIVGSAKQRQGNGQAPCTASVGPGWPRYWHELVNDAALVLPR